MAGNRALTRLGWKLRDAEKERERQRERAARAAERARWDREEFLRDEPSEAERYFDPEGCQ